MQEAYQNISDEALIRKSRGGEEEATAFLLEKYKGMVRAKARFLHMWGGDAEDMIQEEMIGLFKAIRDFDEGEGAAFSTFANLCVTRQLYTAVEASGRKKHRPLNTALSLNDEGSGETKGEREAQPIAWLSAGAAFEPEARVIDEENVRRLEHAIREGLSPLERRVLEEYLQGRSYAQIAEKIGKSEKSVDNAMSRLRAKLKSLLV